MIYLYNAIILSDNKNYWNTKWTNTKKLRWVREALHKRVHTVWHYLLGVLKQAKPICDGKSKNTFVYEGVSLIADMQQVLAIWVEDQTSYNIPWSQILIQSKAWPVFTSRKAERDEEAAEEKFRAIRDWFKFKKRSHLYNMSPKWSSKCWCRRCKLLRTFS